MLQSTPATALLVVYATAMTIAKRETCSGSDDSRGPWTLAISDSSWIMEMDCADGQGNQNHTTMDLNECIGNSWGKLVSGEKYGIHSPALY